MDLDGCSLTVGIVDLLGKEQMVVAHDCLMVVGKSAVASGGAHSTGLPYQRHLFFLTCGKTLYDFPPVEVCSNTISVASS
jgi:hypothetical protein